MRAMVYLIVAGIVFLMVFMYACLIVAAEEDNLGEKEFEKWREQHESEGKSS